MTLNSICGEPIQTHTFEYEYEGTLYEELEEASFRIRNIGQTGRANTSQPAEG